MNFLQRIIQSHDQLAIDQWIILREGNDVQRLDELSHHEILIFFKHSTRCGISVAAKDRLEKHWDRLRADVIFGYVDLLRYRDVSDLIAEKYGVVHQSPQIVIVKNGKAIYHTSHHRISIDDINRVLAPDNSR